MYQRHFEDIIRYFNEHHPRRADPRAPGLLFANRRSLRRRPLLRGPGFQLPWNGSCSIVPFGEDTSAAHHYRRLNDGLSPEDLETLDALCQPVHGLFEVRRLLPKKHRVVLRDLCAIMPRMKSPNAARWPDSTKTACSRRVWSMRDDQWHFMRAFVMFPDETRGFLKKQMKRMRKAGIEGFSPVFHGLAESMDEVPALRARRSHEILHRRRGRIPPCRLAI